MFCVDSVQVLSSGNVVLCMPMVVKVGLSDKVDLRELDEIPLSVSANRLADMIFIIQIKLLLVFLFCRCQCV